MFSAREKHWIAGKIQSVIKATGQHELPEGEVEFLIRIQGKEGCWAEIRNNGAAVFPPEGNPHIELMVMNKRKEEDG